MKTPADELLDWFVEQGLNFDDEYFLSSGEDVLEDNCIVFREYGGAGGDNLLPIDYPGVQINFYNRSYKAGSQNAWDAYYSMKETFRGHELHLPTWRIRKVIFNQTPQDMGTVPADNGEVYYWTVFNVLLDVIKRNV